MPTFQLIDMLTRAFVLEWSAALLTIGGAWLLATAKPNPKGWLLFLAANALWIAFALDMGLRGLLVQQLVLTCISLKGIYTGLVESWLDQRCDAIFDNVTKGKS